MTSSAAYSIWTMKMMCYLASNVTTTVLLHHATFKKGHDEDDVRYSWLLMLMLHVPNNCFITPCQLYCAMMMYDRAVRRGQLNSLCPINLTLK